MDVIDSSVDVMSTVCFLLIMLLNSNIGLPDDVDNSAEDDSQCQLNTSFWFSDSTSAEMDMASQAALNHFRIWSSAFLMDEDLGFWVKPRSTTWFFQFLVQEYDDRRWIEMFRFTKRSVFRLSAMLAPAIRKKDTKYRLAVPVAVRLACTLFKLSHGASFLICSELFAVGRSTMSIMLREVVQAINVGLRNEILWPWGDDVSEIAGGFQQLCGLPGIVGAIDGTHIEIAKPRFASSDYYYFKSRGYTINCQAVVDNKKCFLDIYVGMPGSTNDSRMLRRSTLYHRGQHRGLWDNSLSFSGLSPYLVGDAGFPLLPWLMVPHRRDSNLSLSNRLFNHKLSRGRSVVENAFSLLKLSFRKLHGKCDLDISIVPDVVTCCALLHNVLLKESHEDVENLLQVLQREDGQIQARHVIPVPEDVADADPDDEEGEGAQLKRSELGVFLSLQRIAMP